MSPTFSLLETFSAGKTTGFNDDLIVETPHFIATIDGVTEDGPSPVPAIVKQVIENLPHDASERDFANLAAKAIEAVCGTPKPDTRMSGATAAVLSLHHRQIWLYGDVGVVFIMADGTHRLHTTPHDWEKPLYAARALLNQLMLDNGELTEDDLYNRDPGREMLMPIRKRQHHLANKPGGYAVLSAMPVPEELVQKVDIPRDAVAILEMTDGYPFGLMEREDFNNLGALEKAYWRTANEDPHCMYRNPGPKGMVRDPETDKLMPYDDRTYVRILVLDFS